MSEKTRPGKRGFWLLLSLAVVLSPLSVPAAEKTWFEVRSPHFRLITDSSEKSGRVVVREFEQMRAVFSRLLPNLKLEPEAPLLIVAPNDETGTRTLFPEFWKRSKVKPAGFFARGWERSLAVVRLDVVRDQNYSQNASSAYSVVYHEYAHSVMHGNFTWLPMWMDEGMAEFYGYTRFERSKTTVGAPSPRAAILSSSPLMSLDKFLDITPASREMRNDRDVQVFYYQAWALVHYLVMSEEMGRGERLRNFLNLLNKGVEQKQAFRDAIGDLKDIGQRLDVYVRGPALGVLVMNNSGEMEEESFVARRLNPAETGVELGAVQVWQGEEAAALPRLEQALKEDPQSALAHEVIAFLQFHEGKDDEAAAAFDKALQRDPKRHLSAYYRLMMKPLARSEAAEDRRMFREGLNHILELNPKYSPAHIQLSILNIREGKLDAALDHAYRAQQINPSRAGYYSLIGNILHRLGRGSEAARTARFVAERWQPPDKDEAIELWERLPQDTRAGTELKKTSPEAGVQAISGRISSTSCSEKEETTTIVVDGKPLTFSTKDNKAMGGFSDTLWYGADHYGWCHHLEGFRTELQYKPSKGGKFSGELLQFYIRVDLPR